MAQEKTTEKDLAYTRIVKLEDSKAAPERKVLEDPDNRDGAVYVCDESLKLSIHIALVTGRPLLLLGKPGTGKSSLAPWVARNLGWRYYEHVITARTSAQDLLYAFDSVRRLADAQARAKGDPELNDFAYVNPGVLWWVIDRASAAWRGADQVPGREAVEPFAALNHDRKRSHAVVLIDEIDKADPDVPNNLLVALGSFTFRVEEIGAEVGRLPQGDDDESTDDPADFGRMLVVITSNDERELPDAFLRRCIVHHLESPDADRLVEIAGYHSLVKSTDKALARAIAERVIELREQAEGAGTRPPSTAEFLDALRACRSLGIEAAGKAWKQIEHVVLRKNVEGGDDDDGDLDA